MNAKTEISEINQTIQALNKRKKALREKRRMETALASKRAMLPLPDEINADMPPIFCDKLQGYSLYLQVTHEELKECFRLDSWMKIMNAVQRLLACDGPDLCLAYRTSGIRQGNRANLIAFKHRFNSGMNCCMQAIREAGGIPHFAGQTRTWSIEEKDVAMDILHRRLSCCFRWLIDVRAGMAFRAVIESYHFRPHYTRNDGLAHHDILNSLCSYVWKDMPDDRGEFEVEWLDRYYLEEDMERRCLAQAMVPLGLEVSRSLRKGQIPGDKSSARTYLKDSFKEICRQCGVVRL